MAKELPYFRFYASEWLEGKITLEDEMTQGLFINICCWYWKKDCDISIDFVSKRLVKDNQMLSKCLDRLIDQEIVKIASDLLEIDFLDTQYKLLTGISLKRRRAGRKGGKAKAKQMPSKSSSYKDNNKDKKDNRHKHVIFYEKQIELSQGKNYQKDYDQFVKFLYGKHPSNIKGEPLSRVLALRKQVTFKSYVNLRNKMKNHEYKGPGIFDTLLNMEKSDKLQIDVLLTLNTWMFKER